MKILNLYAGIGGNRKLWGEEHEITAVEFNQELANIYKKFYPKDIVIVGIMNDSVFMAHELLLKCPSKYAKTTDEFDKYKSKSVE